MLAVVKSRWWWWWRKGNKWSHSCDHPTNSRLLVYIFAFLVYKYLIGMFKAGRSSQTQLAACIRISLYKVDFKLRQVHVSRLIQIINL